MKTEAETIADLRKKLRKARADLNASEASNAAIDEDAAVLLKADQAHAELSVERQVKKMAKVMGRAP